MSNERSEPKQRWYEWTMADRLRVARERAGYDQRQFAAVTGISRATIVKYEHGTSTPRPPMLAAWCLATGFSKEWIKTGKKPDGSDGGESANASITLWNACAGHRDKTVFLKVAA